MVFAFYFDVWECWPVFLRLCGALLETSQLEGCLGWAEGGRGTRPGLKESEQAPGGGLACRKNPHLPLQRAGEAGPGCQGSRRASGADVDLRNHLTITALDE